MRGCASPRLILSASLFAVRPSTGTNDAVLFEMLKDSWMSLSCLLPTLTELISAASSRSRSRSSLKAHQSFLSQYPNIFLAATTIIIHNQYGSFLKHHLTRQEVKKASDVKSSVETAPARTESDQQHTARQQRLSLNGARYLQR